MATVDKDFKVKNGLQVGGPTNLVNYTAASPSNPFIGQLWISENSLYAWSSASSWVLIGDGNTGGVSASGTPLNIPETLVSRSASGSFQIGSVDFHTASPVPSAIGRMTWDDGSGTAVLGLTGGNVNLKLGQEEIARCYNGTGSTIPKGRVVYISGAQGQRPSISLSNASTESTSSKTFGVTAESIANGAEGLVCTFGIVEGIDTSVLNEGSALWLSSSSGLVTDTMPTAPIHSVFIGYCIKSNVSSGSIFVKIQNGYEIEELHNVLITSASNNNIISYNSASSLWINKNLQDAIKEVDGSGSGIDSDLLDGNESAYFINTSSVTQTKAGDLIIEGTLNAHNLYVTGSTVYLDTTSLQVNDPVIYLGMNQYTSDILDIGFIAPYGDIGSSSAVGNHYHTGLIRDHSDKKWKLLANADHPVNDIFDFGSPSVVYATLVIGSLEVSSSAKVTNLNADLLDGYNSDYFLAANAASSIYATIASPTFTGTPAAPTATVDTNTTQIATTAYVVGQGYLKSATASSTYIPLSTPTTGTASIVYSNHPTLVRPLLQSPQELATVSATQATASINYDVLSQTVLYYTSSAIGNWHLNVRGNSSNTLSSLLEVGESITLVFGVDQGTTAYYQLNFMIDGTQVVPRWQGGSAPTGGNISGTDIYSYTIIKTAATPTYRVFAALTGFA